MSYARSGPDSDVYVFATTRGYECMGRSKHHPIIALQQFTFADSYVAPDLPMLFAHLFGHVLEGQKVPAHCFERLLEELAKR